MRNVMALARREINTAFFSPMAFIVLTIFLFASGFFFYLLVRLTNEANLGGEFQLLYFLFMVAIPFLTMRMLSEEYRSGAIETLMTAPVTDAQVILGKFLGAILFFIFMVIPTLIYVALISHYGKPDTGQIISSYVGLIAIGSAFTALSLFCSALSGNQVIAGVLAFVSLFILWVIGEISGLLPSPFREVIAYLGTLPHMLPFLSGKIGFRDLFYFFSFSAFWLFLSVRVLEGKRWR